MAKKKSNTRGRIVAAAWKLFYEQGYEDTTIDDIVEESATSKGSFYYYFKSKDALLSSISDLFDEKYEELEPSLDSGMTSVDKLLFLNSELFKLIENRIPVDILSRLFAAQLITKEQRHLLNQDRSYYKLLRKILMEGQDKGEIRKDMSINEAIKAYAVIERGLMYDWCLCNGDYSLSLYSASILPIFLSIYDKR